MLDDNIEMAEKAEQYLEAGDVSVTIEVIAEVIYVLKGVYSLERDIIVDTVKNFMELVSYSENEVLNFALDTFGKRNLDFVDCVLYAYHVVSDVEVATFDKKFLKLMANL